MKIESQKKFQKLNKLHSSSMACKMRISPDGLLRITKDSEITLAKYTIYMNNELYIRDGARWCSSVPLPADGLNVCVNTASKLAVMDVEGTFEYITPKKCASEDFRFLLYAVHRNSLRLIFVDGSISSKWFMRTVKNTEETIDFYESIVSVILNKFDPDAARVHKKFFEEKVEA